MLNLPNYLPFLEQPDLTEIVKEGTAADLDFCLRTQRKTRYIETSLAVLAYDLIDTPGDFKNKPEIIEVMLKHGFDYGDIFSNEKQTDTIWTMYARSPSNDTKQAAAILLSELLKMTEAKFNARYQIPFDKILGKPDSLTGSFKQQKLEESILVTQNALVAYVAQEGPKLPVNRGAAFLNLIAKDVESDLWVRNMTGIKGSKYCPLNGDLTFYKAVFSPQPS
ncbi:MAG: hypothetical protein DI586_05210 [Micavibrio aeruginosavorus]|uniref:Uncharacterized protein n=1 Tax=Micavibrio aeruginosavorus TaxID=349221 RepID=A0A2W5FJ74_9BACT|nr:MAG: hypothetical protein DI586_05210 [Micavibrio aeruginosavorus]